MSESGFRSPEGAEIGARAAEQVESAWVWLLVLFFGGGAFICILLAMLAGTGM